MVCHEMQAETHPQHMHRLGTPGMPLGVASAGHQPLCGRQTTPGKRCSRHDDGLCEVAQYGNCKAGSGKEAQRCTPPVAGCSSQLLSLNRVLQQHASQSSGMHARMDVEEIRALRPEPSEWMGPMGSTPRGTLKPFATTRSSEKAKQIAVLCVSCKQKACTALALSGLTGPGSVGCGHST